MNNLQPFVDLQVNLERIQMLTEAIAPGKLPDTEEARELIEYATEAAAEVERFLFDLSQLAQHGD